MPIPTKPRTRYDDNGREKSSSGILPVTSMQSDQTMLCSSRLKDDNGKEISFPYSPGDKGLQSDQSRLLIQTKGIFNLPYFNRLSAGVDMEINWLDAPRRLDEKNVSDNTGSFYLQDEWSPFSQLNITAGARLTLNNNFGMRATPKVSALYKLGDCRTCAPLRRL